jgi:hypothetical protein
MAAEALAAARPHLSCTGRCCCHCQAAEQRAAVTPPPLPGPAENVALLVLPSSFIGQGRREWACSHPHDYTCCCLAAAATATAAFYAAAASMAALAAVAVAVGVAICCVRCNCCCCCCCCCPFTGFYYC